MSTVTATDVTVDKTRWREVAGGREPPQDCLCHHCHVMLNESKRGKWACVRFSSTWGKAKSSLAC
jgi:hypothetical protein